MSIFLSCKMAIFTIPCFLYQCNRKVFLRRSLSVNNTKGKTTNSEFIALIADKLQLQLKSAEVGNL